MTLKIAPLIFFEGYFDLGNHSSDLSCHHLGQPKTEFPKSVYDAKASSTDIRSLPSIIADNLSASVKSSHNDKGWKPNPPVLVPAI